MNERCDAVASGLQCELEAGHDGDHRAELDLTPGKMFAAAWDDMEAATEHARNMERYFRRARNWMYVAAGANITVALFNVWNWLVG